LEDGILYKDVNSHFLQNALINFPQHFLLTVVYKTKIEKLQTTKIRVYSSI